MFEIKYRDGQARIGKWTINNKKIETPNIAVVINPNKQIISPKELKKLFGTDIIITNAYITLKSKNKEEILEKGLHKYYDFDGIIYTDSGTFQMYSQKHVTITNKQSIEFQYKLGSDILTPLDLFTLPTDSKETAIKKLNLTFERIKYLEDFSKEHNTNFSYPLQGGLHLDLRKKAATQALKTNPSIYAIGGIVPLMENYQFYDLMRIVFEITPRLRKNIPVHAFGAGHPIIFPLLVMAGVDLFDSASYALFAKQRRYLTPDKTYYVDELEYPVCNCPICSKVSPKEMTEKEVALHNLYVIYKEITTIKENIRQGTFYDYVESRIDAHPELVKAYRLLKTKKIKDYLLSGESSTKTSALFWKREETKYRPMFNLAKEKLKFVKSKFEKIKWFNNIEIPLSLALTYPFNNFQYIDKKEHYDKVIEIMEDPQKRIDLIKDILAYQLESPNPYKIDFKNIEVKLSKNKRIKHLVQNNKIIATLRSLDNTFTFSLDFVKQNYEVLKEDLKYVVVNEEAEEFIKKGKSVFAKFVIDASENIRPNDFVIIVNKKQEILNVGYALLTPKEMKEFNIGVAVKVK